MYGSDDPPEEAICRLSLEVVSGRVGLAETRIVWWSEKGSGDG